HAPEDEGGGHGGGDAVDERVGARSSRPPGGGGRGEAAVVRPAGRGLDLLHGCKSFPKNHNSRPRGSNSFPTWGFGRRERPRTSAFSRLFGHRRPRFPASR